MTETPEEVALATQTQTAGEALAAADAAHGEQMLSMPGGGVDVSASNRSPDDGAVPWTGTSSEPPAVSPQPTSSPNVVSPYDNSPGA